MIACFVKTNLKIFQFHSQHFCQLDFSRFVDLFARFFNYDDCFVLNRAHIDHRLYILKQWNLIEIIHVNDHTLVRKNCQASLRFNETLVVKSISIFTIDYQVSLWRHFSIICINFNCDSLNGRLYFLFDTQNFHMVAKKLPKNCQKSSNAIIAVCTKIHANFCIAIFFNYAKFRIPICVHLIWS